MPLVLPLGLRRADFEVMEPRLMLAADAALPASPAFGTTDMELYLPGSISGGVFAATRAEGLRQAGDAGISGVRIELLSAAGEVLAEAITSEMGDYEFPALTPGTYALRQIQPAGWIDGFELTGSGGGTSPATNVITQIVVQPGAMLVGYDFAEIAAPVQGAGQIDEAASLIGFMQPLAVSWSRPIELIAPVPIEPMASRPLLSLPPEPKPAEPIFGGSSRVLGRHDAALEALSSEDEAEDEFARRTERMPSKPAGEDTSRDGDRLASKDRAFASEDVVAQDEAAIDGPEAEDEVTDKARRPVVARQPATTGEAAKKPAA